MAQNPQHPRQIVDVGVIGSINEDTIEHEDGRIDSRLGGVLFTACALGYLGAGALRVWLLSRAHSRLRLSLQQQLVHVPGLRLEGLLETPFPGYRCHITYDSDGEKTEVLSGNVEPLTLDDLAPFLPRLQALAVNFITGYEISCEDLAAVRDIVDGPLFMDVHSLTLGRHADGTRFPAPLANADKWIAAADVVQMNEAEARILGAPGEDAGAPTDGPAPTTSAALLEWATGLLEWGPKAVVITRGASGAVSAWRDADGRTGHVEQEAPTVAGERLDTTGCGDVFLAALVAAHFRGEQLPAAIERANHVAAWNCQLSGIDELHRLPLE